MARKNKGLPFVVQPRLKPITERLGSEVSGVIEIERRGYLTVAEKAIVQNAMGESSYLTEAYMIAKSIGAKEGIAAQRVFDDLSKEDQPEYMDKYRSELSQVMAAMIAHEEKLRLVAASTLIMTRVEPEWDPSDTVGLHPDLQAALYQLYNEEDKKSIEALEEAANSVDKGQDGAEGKE